MTVPTVATVPPAAAAALNVEVELAHHLEWPRDSGYHYKPLDLLVVTREQAVELCAAGYLTCDPSQADQVAKVMDNTTDEALTADTQAEVAAEAGLAPPGEPSMDWTHAQLQDAAREAGLPTGGSKAALVERLTGEQPDDETQD